MNLVVLTGAGISAESGLQTFRDSKDGLWNGYDINEVATPEAWERNPKLVLDFYNWRRAEANQAQPNKAHIKLAEAEAKHHIHIITQNVDDLHERAGSTQVLHLHGQLNRMRSTHDPLLNYPIEGDIEIGQTADDGHQLRPDIVWFGEEVPMMEMAIAQVAEADALIVIGTSLVVYPAAGLVNYCSENAAIYILDKHIPPIRREVFALERKATEGIEELLAQFD